MNDNLDRQPADQARFSLPRLARLKPPGQDEEGALDEPVREDLDETLENKPPVTLVKRPVPVAIPSKPEIPPRELKTATPPSLARRNNPGSSPLVSRSRRPQDSSPRPSGPRVEASAVPAPVGKSEPRIIAPPPVSLPSGIQRGFPRPQNGSNGAGREPMPAPLTPFRPANAGQPAPIAPIPPPPARAAVPLEVETPLAAAVSEAPPAWRESSPEHPQSEFFLEEILDRLANTPAQTALLGVCDDQLPVLLDLTDPAPGAILVVSDDDMLRARLLRTLVQTSAALNSPRSVQFIVFSAYPQEWQAWIEGQEIMRHCLSVERLPQLGEDPATEGSPERWLLKLSGWADQRRSGGISGPAVILVVDDLQSATTMEYDARVNFDWLVKEGPAVGIWPVVGLKAARAKELTRWVRLFKTRLLGPSADPGLLKLLSANSDVQVEPTQFAVRVQDQWLKFRVPILPNEVY